MWQTRQTSGPTDINVKHPRALQKDIGDAIVSVQIKSPRLQLCNAYIARIADQSLEYRARISNDDAKIDLWCKGKQKRPAMAVFLLAQEIYFQIEYFDQAIWFNRTEDRDELWAITEEFTELRPALAELRQEERAGYIDNFGRHCAGVFSVPRARSFDESLIDLLSCYFGSGAGTPLGVEHMTAAGYISSAQFETLHLRVRSDTARREREHKEWSRQARENETEIIRVARELGLHPEPAGFGPVQWYATCPKRRGHRRMITTGHDEFGCGCCSVKGGVEELRALGGEQASPT